MRAGATEARRRVCAEGAAGTPAVAFAGEHACPEHQMTVHAAMESGERAAAQASFFSVAGALVPCPFRLLLSHTDSLPRLPASERQSSLHVPGSIIGALTIPPHAFLRRSCGPSASRTRSCGRGSCC